MVNDLDYEVVQFPLSKKDFRNIEKKKKKFALMYILMKINYLILFMSHNNNLRIVCIY